MITWKQFAWAAFLYGAIGGDKFYFSLMNNADFIAKLHDNPNTLTDSEIRDNLLKFLHQWSTRGVPKNCAGSLLEKIISIHPHLAALRSNNVCITTVSFQDSLTVNGTERSIEAVIKDCYKAIIGVKGCGPTATAKILHILYPELFVMWDGPILEHFKPTGIRGSATGYFKFLEIMKANAQEVLTSFQAQSSLSPASTHQQSPENYLSVQLDHNPPKTMAKYLDEYYWVTVTNGVTVPPIWHPDLIV